MTSIHVRGAMRSHACRFHLALAASAGLHFLVTSTLSGLPERGAGRPVSFPLTVHLDLPAAVSNSVPDSERVDASLRQHSRPAGPSREPRAALHSNTAAGAQRAPTPLPPPLEQSTAIYTARELDTLPTPVSAIAIDRLPGIEQAAASGGYRIELTIDERGVVLRLDLLGPTAPGPVERELRAAFEEARFIPARKEGRAVRSRIVLQVRAGTEAGVP